MKNSFVLMSLIFLSLNIFSQTVYSPQIDRKGEKDVYIRSVVTSDYYTQINFIYRNSKSQGHYILLNAPGHADAYYIKANGRIYKLISTQKISNYNNVTVALPGETVEFSARFERLPSYTTRFDLIEGTSGTWDFFGVQLKEAEEEAEVKKFRRDYSLVCFYDPQTETWSDWKSGDNTFVININERGDVAHIKANGETVIYKRLSGVEEDYTKDGSHYQIIKALDEDGDVFRFQLFDDTTIGLKMMWGSFMIQFAAAK